MSRKPYYEGVAFSPEDILLMLERQGLQINDRDRALRVLYNVSYSRLKNYLIPLMSERKSHKFRPGASFEDAYALYGFDRRLRELIFHEMEKIEISIRTRVAYASNCSEKGYWFLNPAHFKSNSEHEKILRHIKMELQRSDNEGIKHFFSKYSNEYPPSWLTLEATSMGTLARIYEELSDEKLRERIAAFYKMTPHTFISWMRHLVELRNDCAHHNRVWDSVPTCKAALPYGLFEPFPKMKEEDRNRVYFSLCIIKYFADRIKPGNSFSTRLKMLVGNFSMVDPACMGFPRNWQEEPYWK